MISLTQFNEGLKTVAVLAFVLVCIFLCSTLVHVNKTLDTADHTLGTVNTEVSNLEGTRQHVDALLGSATTVLNDTDAAAKKETSVLDAFNTQINSTLSNINTAVTAITSSQGELTAHTVQTLDATTAAINNLKPVVSSLQTTVADIDSTVKNPAIAQTVEQVHELTIQATGTASNLNKTTADVQQAVHTYLHPSWATKLKNLLLNTGTELGKYFL